MDPTITAALITAAVTIAVVIITNSYQNRRVIQIMEIKLALRGYENLIGVLRKKS